MNIEQMVQYLREDASFRENVTAWKTIPAASAQFADFPDTLDPRILNFYTAKGIECPYTHQRAAFDAAMRGEDFVVVTPTASGKTLCYNIPVINELAKNPDARALYLFPTKALAQDQMHEALRVIEGAGLKLRTWTFDGDTPSNARKVIRESGHIVITNPDMLHSGILPHHAIWVKLFENLKYIVIDEVHHYRGIFGSHLANVIRRLRRLAAFYGSTPQFILCSATIANPAEHAAALIGRPVTLIDNNGAPRGERHVVIYNPPVVNQNLGMRASSVKEVAKIGTMLAKNRIPTIVFARSRLRVEVISSYIKESAPGAHVAAYRGGYLANERRRIEKDLRERVIDCVVATNALELGIDIGMLDAVVSTGYPGSVSSLLQQFGRAGRRSATSLAILTASSTALDQYIAENPSFLTEANPERAVINPDNLLVLMDHIKCAAFELPFTDDERFAPHLGTTREILDYLATEGVLKHAGGKYHWMSDIYPAGDISLRSASQENFVIVDTSDNNTVIGEIDYHGAPTMIHTDAIYLHQGREYYIDNLDWERRTAYCHEVDSDYYTDAQSKTDIHVLNEDARLERGVNSVSRGEITLREQAVMFKKIKFNTHENLGWGKISLPEIEMHTGSLWIDFDPAFLEGIAGKAESGALLYSLSYLVNNIAPVHLFCDPMDIRTSAQNRSSFSGRPALFVYDAIPGGSGLASRLYDILDLVLGECLRHMSSCACANGCPGCIGPVAAGTENSKAMIVNLIMELSCGPHGKAETLH